MLPPPDQSSLFFKTNSMSYSTAMIKQNTIYPLTFGYYFYANILLKK